MRKDYFAIALMLSLAAGRAGADVLAMPEGDPTPQIVLPAKGLSMADVEKRYGEPRSKQAPVGGDSPRQPPITRWDYDAFKVIFERDKVIDAVVPGAPPRIHNRGDLAPVVTMAPAPAAEPETLPADPIPEAPVAPPAAEAPAAPAADLPPATPPPQ